MFGITDFATYFVAVLVIIALPGPNSLYCLSVSASYGHSAGWRALAGILLGDTILMVATILGAGTLMRLYPEIFELVKIIGGVYLGYLGIRLLLAAYQGLTNRQLPQETVPKPVGRQNYFYRSLGLSLTNPKAILFFLSFFVQFVNPNYDKPWLGFLILAMVLQAVSFSYLALLIYTGRALAEKFAKRRVLSAIMQAAAGVLFVGFGINLWLSQL
ncbi:leucine efflux protein [Moraxella cuniculi DSM 21768]|uniref:Leucine efflux protein n=1 Tax=Moraxella cuniculi DSM 21768 TaxID=1122245 RepID=A0A1N7EDI7_9GAMM|nr:leucine efflux protein LeuE [Moraxella cuniculi]SIR86140.1 leucine efflux protein [Moraxella cuniculi DSM 21768]